MWESRKGRSVHIMTTDAQRSTQDRQVKKPQNEKKWQEIQHVQEHAYLTRQAFQSLSRCYLEQQCCSLWNADKTESAIERASFDQNMLRLKLASHLILVRCSSEHLDSQSCKEAERLRTNLQVDSPHQEACSLPVSKLHVRHKICSITPRLEMPAAFLPAQHAPGPSGCGTVLSEGCAACKVLAATVKV